MRSLDVQETSTIDVRPDALYFPSGIRIESGARYRFQASGKWKDGSIFCGPEGWNGLILQAWNRLPWQRFFRLCGTVGENLDHAFAIGPGLDWSAPIEVAQLSDQQLYLFANDWPSRYGNNKALTPDQGGPLRVSITRLT